MPKSGVLVVSRVQTLPTSDFRGGVNYNADAFQLGPNQVSDALNVDFDPNGGFTRRDPVTVINSSGITAAKNIWSFITSNAGTKQIIVQDGNDAAYSTGANFTNINPDALATTGTMYAATANDKNYIMRNAERAAFTWNGTASAVLTDAHGAYNDNLAAPAGGKMPLAKYIAFHRNYLFVANTVESGTARTSRIRFSHPFSDLTGTKGAEDWRTNDWIEVSPGDGDQITGIISWQERLYIFKNRSVWALSGYDPNSFQLDNVSRDVGAIDQKAIAIGDEGIYFFSWPNGLQLFDGKQVRDLWYNMTPLTAPRGSGTLIGQQSFDANYATNTAIGYVNQRCWVAATSVGATTNDMTFVFDPRLGKEGGWTQYDLPLAAFTKFHPPSGTRYWYAINASDTSRVVKLHESANLVDGLVSSLDTPISSYVYTRWFDLENPAVIKRWKHPIFVCDSNDDQTLPCEVFRDYDFTSAVKNFDLTITGPPSPATWGSATWGAFTWASDTTTGAQTILKGASLGRGTAIALKINGPSTGDQDWSVNSVTFKYIPRRVRN